MADNAPPAGLTSEELAEVVLALREKRVPKPCEMCDLDAWVVGQYLASPVLLLKAGEQLAPDYNLLQSSVVVLCSNCGNTKMFSAKTLGIGIR